MDRGHATVVIRRTVENLGPRHDQVTFDIDVPGAAVAVALRTLGTRDGQPIWYRGDLLDRAIILHLPTISEQRRRTEAAFWKQFEAARQIIAAGLVPIVEPEVDIHCPDKGEAETLLKAAILEALHALPVGQLVMLKLTLPEKDDLYAEFVKHPKVVRVVALSGGYTREEGNERLRRNHGVVASFSRALVEGLSAQQSDAEFNAMLDASIQSIFEASNT